MNEVGTLALDGLLVHLGVYGVVGVPPGPPTRQQLRAEHQCYSG